MHGHSIVLLQNVYWEMFSSDKPIEWSIRFFLPDQVYPMKYRITDETLIEELVGFCLFVIIFIG